MFRIRRSSLCSLGRLGYLGRLGGPALVAALLPACGFCQAAPSDAPAGPELRVFDPSLIDKSVDPCDNFYRYSCNGWFKRNPLPARPDFVWPLYRAV